MMNMRCILLFSTILFFFLFSSISFAYLPMISNSSIFTMDYNGRGLGCLNLSADNKIRCFYATAGGGCPGGQAKIWMFNESGGNLSSCDVLTCGMSYVRGMALINETYMMVSYMNQYCYVFNITNLTTFTSDVCTAVNASADDTICGGDISSSGTGIQNGNIVWPGSNKVFNTNFSLQGTGDANMTAPYNYATLGAGMYAFTNNKTDGSTLYVSDSLYPTAIYKLTGGALAATIDPDTSLWDINSSASHHNIDLVKINSTTTFGYILKYVNTNKYKLFIVNFSQADIIQNSSLLIAIYPINNTSISNVANPTATMKINITTDFNGTISWYLNGTLLGNTSITNAPLLTNTTYYYNTGVLTDGQYIWSANYTDSYGTTWDTGTQYFWMAETSAITTIAQNLADAFGVDIDAGKVLFGLLISIVMSGALAYWVKWQLFLPGMMICMVFFAFVGFFPSWMSLVLVVIAAAIFAKYAGLMR